MEAGGPVFRSLESRVEEVDEAEAWVRQFAAGQGFDESDQYFIGLAVREVVVNAIKHGNRFDLSKKVGLTLGGAPGELVVEVSDEGEGFLLEEVPDAQVAENLERRSGRGLLLARRIMDAISVHALEPAGTRVRLVKRVAAPGADRDQM
ncbi:MAG: ATP-binding protein [Acidobacteria bacterium]|nr:ATP-binding protein [Acidobacteriota bacterium]